MKTITFKTLSILLAAVLLVAVLPVAAFAEDVSPCAIIDPCIHIYDSSYEEIVGAERIDGEVGYWYHYQIVHRHNICTLCGVEGEITVLKELQAHHEVVIGDGVTLCTICNSIFWG